MRNYGQYEGRIGRYLAEEVAAPLGLDYWIGLPEQHESRVARLVRGHSQPFHHGNARRPF